VLKGHAQSSYQIGQQPVPHFVALAGSVWPELFASTPVAAAVVLLGLASVVWAADARRRVVAGGVLACAILPILVVWVISHGPDSYWTFRYMLFTIPAWAVAAGLGATGIAERVRGRLRVPWPGGAWRPGFAAVAAGLVAFTAVLGAHDQWKVRESEAHNLWALPVVTANGEPVDYPAAAAVLAAHERAGDGIVYQVSDANHYPVDTAMAYYLHGKPLPKAVFQAQTPIQANSLQPVECASPSTCLTGTPRLWVVYVDRFANNALNPFSAIQGNEAAYLQALGYQTKALYREDGITVALLAVG
jgi:mannosyltransferase